MRISTCSSAVAVLMLAGAAAGYAQQPVKTQPDTQRVSAARQLLKASGAADLMVVSIRAALPSQREANPQVPEEFWKKFEERLVQEAPMLSDSIAAVYATSFSLDELKALTAFYNSALGQRLRTVQPDILNKSTAIGQRWGARIGEEVATSLQH